MEREAVSFVRKTSALSRFAPSSAATRAWSRVLAEPGPWERCSPGLFTVNQGTFPSKCAESLGAGRATIAIRADH